MRRALAAAVLVGLLCAEPYPASARPGWKRRIDALAAGRSIGIAIVQDGRFVYRWASRRRRVPASNQKLLTAMALFDVLGPGHRITTTVAARRVRDGVVRGPLWVLGRGDPAIATKGRFARALPLPVTRVRRLARAITGAGVRRIDGRVVGSRAYFRHDWHAPGWRPHYRRLYIPLPSALTFNGNVHARRHTATPERHLARALTKVLRSEGVRVAGRPRAGYPRAKLSRLGRVRSRPLGRLVRFMTRTSSNFFAEVLGKRLAVARWGRPGTIAGAARAISGWAAAHGVVVRARDASGLSYGNRISAAGLVRLLNRAARKPWGRRFRRGLAAGGQGTLEHRLRGVRVRAKTGTLLGVSALSGWVWRRRARTWATFSILSRGLDKDTASSIEDRIVRVVARSGRPA